MNVQIPLLAFSAFTLPLTAAVSIDWVSVRNPGNLPDPLTGYGAVARDYQIGKFAVTIAQYAGFLNAKAQTDPYGLYDVLMPSFGITRGGTNGSYSYSLTPGFENRPVVRVTWFNAARFSNWIANGQDTGDTETGSYTLNGATIGIINANPGALVYLPSEDEWYKAAYYNGLTSTYSLYPNGSNTITKAEANYGESFGSVKNVGSYPLSPSAYGTFDQGGNTFEYLDGVIGSSRVIRGGNWFQGAQFLASTSRTSYPTNGRTDNVGFRLASIPEPNTTILTVMLGAAALARRKRSIETQ